MKKKVLVIVGATATGKSYLAVRLAKKLGGEVISADSRQVYRGLDLGTGKITKAEMKGIPHHLIDVVDPKNRFTVLEYQKTANKIIAEILARGKLPIICGGTGFYVASVTEGIILPEVPPNSALRLKLAKKSASDLFKLLKKLDPERAKNIDPHNSVRLIRAIEVAKHLGKVPKIKIVKPKYEFIKIGIRVPEEALKKKIRIRLRKRIRAGMAIEIYNLHKKGVPWKRFEELGFDQKFIALYLQDKMKQTEMFDNLFKGNWQYAKRQETWFKRDKDIEWFNPKEYRKIMTYVSGKIPPQKV